jgi:hypothetical protein
MRNFLLMLFILATSCVSQAERKQSAWENLTNLRTGEKIEVRQLHAKKVKGAFLNFTDAEISLQAPGGPQSIAKQDVQSVTRMRNKHRLRNALIAGGVGGGIGAGIGAATHKSCSSSQTFCLDIGGRSLPAAVGAVIGLLGGATAGALLPDHESVYTTDPH